MAQKIRWPPLARTVVIPPLVEEKVAAIRRISREIAAIVRHFQADAVRAHDRRSALALERKRNRRGELLMALQEQDPRVYVNLAQSLKEQRSEGEEP